MILASWSSRIILDEQLWLQCPWSSWSSTTSGTASKRARWRVMALKCLLLYHMHSQSPSDGVLGPMDRAFQNRQVQGHAQPGSFGYEETPKFSRIHVLDLDYGETRAQQQSQVLFGAQSRRHGIVQADVQGGFHDYGKASAHQASVHSRRHGYGKLLTNSHNETLAHQQGQVHLHAQVQGHQYGQTLGQQKQQTWQVHGEALAQHQQPAEEPVAHRPLPKRLLPIPVTRRNFSTNPRCMNIQNSIPIADTIQLTDLEFKIFNILKAFLIHYDLRTQPRVAGGWVRDKLLGRQCGDIDITLDDMLGRTFCRKLSTYCRMAGMEITGFGVIKSNPMQAKHLEVAKMDILGKTIDFVNLRSHDYTESSSLPFINQDFGTIVEDAFRRDLTINSLFYNIITERVEDPTGKGLFDLRSKIIATPLPPKVTFTDDPLRVLRALRFVAVLDYDLHPDAKDAIDADIKLALAAKISRQRIGGEVQKMLSCVNPLKAFELLEETQLFPIIFSPPAELDIILPEGIERACLHALEAVIDVVQHFGSSKLQVEDRKILYLAAFLSPMRAFVYEHNGKLISASTAIIKESLKLRSIDAAMVATLHKTAGNFTSIRKLVLKLDTIDQGNGEHSITDSESQISFSHAKLQIGMLLEEMRGLWRLSLLLGAIFEEEEFLFSMPPSMRKAELVRRSHLCIFMEEAFERRGELLSITVMCLECFVYVANKRPHYIISNKDKLNFVHRIREDEWSHSVRR